MQSTPRSPYARLGGAPAIDRLVDSLYDWMAKLPEARAVQAMHPDDMNEVKARLRAFLSGWLGGPDLYRPAYGEPMMCRRHARFTIGAAERDVWMSCMNLALHEIVADAALRDELYWAFGAMADRLVNHGDAADPRSRACGIAA